MPTLIGTLPTGEEHEIETPFTNKWIILRKQSFTVYNKIRLEFPSVTFTRSRHQALGNHEFTIEAIIGGGGTQTLKKTFNDPYRAKNHVIRHLRNFTQEYIDSENIVAFLVCYRGTTLFNICPSLSTEL